MRKFLWVVAVGAMVLALAAPAMALDFKFGSEYRVRFYDGMNNGFSDAAGTNPRGVQIRVRPRFDVSDDNGNVTATLRLEIGDIEFGNGGGAQGVTNGVNITPGSSRVGNGAGGSLGLDGVNVETKWAYVDFALPFGVPARMRAGLQPWYLPKGLIIDDDIAGVRVYGTTKPFSYEVAWYRASGGPITTAVPSGAAGQSATSNTLDNNYDFYQFKVDLAAAPWLNPGLYYVYGDNRVNCSTAATACPPSKRTRESHFVGLTSTGKVGIVSYDVDWVYGSADGGPTGAFAGGGSVATPVRVKGWAADGAVHFPIGPVTVNLAASYATGDADNGQDSEAFPYIAPSWNGAGGGFEMIGSGGPFDAVEFTQDMPTNLWMLGGWLEYRPVKALWLKVAYGYAGFVKKAGNCASATTCFGPTYSALQGKASLGQELSFRADYDLWTGFKVQGQVGWLFPSGGSASKTAGEYVLQLYYNF